MYVLAWREALETDVTDVVVVGDSVWDPLAAHRAPALERPSNAETSSGRLDTEVRRD